MLKWMYFSFMVLTSFLAVIISSDNNKSDVTLVLAQAATNNNNNNNNTLQSTLSSQPPSITHGVKITSPTKGQQVSIGKDITISGTSLANPNSNCQITVIVNHVKPYQPATAAGPEGSKDYSKWNFVLSSKYTTIHQGQNKITAKYNCNSANPGGLSFNSVNVTGLPAAVTSAATIQPSHQQQQQQQSITTENNNSNTTTSSEPTGIPGIL
jgi:hypothetical protein